MENEKIMLRELLSSSMDPDDVEESILREIVGNGQKIAIWGGGLTSEMVSDRIEKAGGEISAYFFGDIWYKDGMTYRGKPGYRISEINNILDNYNLLLCAGTIYPELSKMVKNGEIGVDGHNVYSLERINNVCRISKEFIEKHISDFESVYELFDEDISRTTFLSYLSSKSGCFAKSELVKPLWQLMVSDHYFNELYQPGEYKENVICDCGAFDGDSVDGFFKYIKDDKARAYAFEPDELNLVEISRNLKKYGDRVSIVKKGLSQKSGRLAWSSDGSCSHVVDDNDVSNGIDVIAGDEYFKHRYVSFIKMDIEGAEADALIGLKETIKRDAPFLAISAYHKADDLFVLPKIIKDIIAEQSDFNYDYKLRIHTPRAEELVFYAIPR